jgi:SAM-dependent methyltransferase
VRKPVELGALRRVTPISADWGSERGLPVDRYYIEQFLARESEAIHGRVLEIGEPRYTARFGGDRVDRGDVLDIDPGNPQATIVADLTRPRDLPAKAFDCAIVVQTLQYVYDVRAAVRSLHRTLRRGGVLLVTVPGITPFRDQYPEPARWCWSFTVFSIGRLVAEAFDPADVVAEAYGNVLAAAAFLYGLATEDLSREELESRDPDYPVTIGVRAVRR